MKTTEQWEGGGGKSRKLDGENTQSHSMVEAVN